MWKKLLAIVLILAVGASILWIVNPFAPAVKVSADTYKGGYRVTAQKIDKSGVALNSTFLLTSENKVTPEFIQEHVTLRGEEKPDIKAEGDAFVITPKSPLLPNKLYFVDIATEDGRIISFAFQTQKDFVVVGSLPENMATNVPVDTGIEIYFSYPDAEDVAEHFTISPKVDGRFEQRGYAWSFVPKKLDPGIVYTITVEGVPAAGGSKVLSEAYTFSFETSPDSAATANPDKGNLFIQNNWFDVSTSELPVIPFDIYLNGNSNTTSAEVTASVYRFADLDSFVKAIREKETVPSWAWYNYSQAKTDTAKLEKVMSFQQTFDLQNWQPRYMMFPESLKEGFYVIELTSGDLRTEAFLQSTDTAAYYLEDQKTGLFWVNDLVSGNPMANASIEDVSGGKAVQTDAKGLAKMELPLNRNYDRMDLFKITSADGRISVLNAGYAYRSYNDGYSTQSLQWRYMQTDRTLYKPDDTVSFWGFLKSRIDGTSPSEITVELNQGGYYYPMYDSFVKCFLPFIMGKPLETLTLKTDGGFYEGSIQLPSLDPGSYTLTVKSGDKILSSSYISVENYIKPQYKLSVTSDKKAAFVGEPITFTVTASFFDGTPVANIPVRYFINEWGGTVENQGVTNTKGELVISYTPKYVDQMQGECYFGFNALAQLPETGEISQYYDFRVYANDITLLTEGKVQDGTATASITAHKFDLTTLNDDDFSNDNNLGAVVAGHQAYVSIYGVTWEKIEAGEEYDYVNKVVRKRYEYRERRDLVAQQSLVTGPDGKASFTFPAPDGFEGYYMMETTSQDSSGRSLRYETYVMDQNQGLYPYPKYNDYYHLKTDKDNYGAGEIATVKFYNAEEPVTGFRTLFVESRNGMFGYDIATSPVYSKAFDEKLAPNYFVDGVLFTGKGYIQSSCAVAYKYEEKKLTLKVTTDKESYKPGEEAVVKITATDKDGKPVNARVNISLVDEALLALSGQYIDPLGQLYAWIESGITRTSSNRYSSPMLVTGARNGYGGMKMDLGGAEGGEMEMAAPVPAPSAEAKGSFSQSMDSAYVRTTFKDTAAFTTVQLDEKGEGSLTIKLPDNVTSFSLNAAAISQDLHAGSEVASTKVSMPFFINDALSLEYLAGDKPYIGVTAYGQDLKEGEEVAYQVKIKELPDYVQTASGKAFERINLPLPELLEGSYTLEIRAASASGLADALNRTITVIPSYRTIETSSLAQLVKDVSITAGKSGLTTLIITDEGRGRIINQLHGLSWGYGHRLDQKLVAHEAQKLLSGLVDSDQLYFDPVDVDALSYKNEDGGYGILPYSESDVKLTALLAPYLKDISDAASLKMYFYNALLSSEQINAAALYGLAVLQEPVLLDLEKAMNTENLSLTDYMLIGMAYAELQETSYAMEIYNTRIAQHLEKKDPYIRVKVSDNDTDACLEQTALLAAFASRIDLEDADKMYDYLKNNYSKNVYTGVEELMYLTHRLAGLPDEAVAFDYSYDGQNYSVKLEKGASEVIRIPSVKASEFKVTKVSGKASVLSLYKAPLTGSVENDRNVTLTRKYYNALSGEETTTFSQNDIVKVEIVYDVKNAAIDNLYEISDYAPSGLKPLSNPWSYNVKGDWGFYYRAIDGQKVTFVVGKPDNSTNKTLIYYARVASPGEYVAEGTVAQGSVVKSSIMSLDGTTIKILP